ncbi:hypothetical protein AGLY_017047, partial [Aphis glycines]
RDRCKSRNAMMSIRQISKDMSMKREEPVYIKVYNFKELNKVVTFYNIGTTELNDCHPELYNGETPITKSAPGINYLYGLEEVIENLKNTEICFNKLSLEIPIMPTEIVNNTYPTCSQMCSEGKFDNSTWCVQNSQNYYDKGQFFRKQNIGVMVTGMDWDDYLNSCKCQSAFNGFYNVLAGYTDSEVIPCPKFDIQSTVYPIK